MCECGNYSGFQINTGGSCCHGNTIVLPPSLARLPSLSPATPLSHAPPAQRARTREERGQLDSEETDRKKRGVTRRGRGQDERGQPLPLQAGPQRSAQRAGTEEKETQEGKRIDGAPRGAKCVRMEHPTLQKEKGGGGVGFVYVADERPHDVRSTEPSQLSPRRLPWSVWLLPHSSCILSRILRLLVLCCSTVSRSRRLTCWQGGSLLALCAPVVGGFGVCSYQEVCVALSA